MRKFGVPEGATISKSIDAAADHNVKIRLLTHSGVYPDFTTDPSLTQVKEVGIYLTDAILVLRSVKSKASWTDDMAGHIVQLRRLYIQEGCRQGGWMLLGAVYKLLKSLGYVVGWHAIHLTFFHTFFIYKLNMLYLASLAREEFHKEICCKDKSKISFTDKIN
ncbi:hypothetical protein K1719_011217 [Acacia pycnantha]|nr:hypothetical protein K1719_011217 [Acacia pycnantha]